MAVTGSFQRGGGSSSDPQEGDSATEHYLARDQENPSRIASRCWRKFPRRRRTATRSSMNSLARRIPPIEQRSRSLAVQHVKFWRRADQCGEVRRSDEEKRRTTFTTLPPTSLRHSSFRTFVRSVLKHCTWWALWIIMPCNSSSISSARKSNPQ